jgi:MFS family permease
VSAAEEASIGGQALARKTPQGRAHLWPLFLVSAGAVGFEIALTRYFAVAKWSEYGYWVISIVMAGFALSGVVVALFRDAFARAGRWLQALLPGALVAAAAAGFHYTVTNPFNPLELQNPATWIPQVQNIGLYYAALLPFFFLAGVFVSLTFVLNSKEIGRVYGYDLTGAGLGSAFVLVLMFILHPFDLAPAILVVLALSALFLPKKGKLVAIGLAVLALAGGEYLLLEGPQPAFNEYKAIYPPLHTPNAKVLSETRSPRGDYLLLDDFTERMDADVSNNATMMGMPDPPRSYGLYRDGVRIASLPKPGAIDASYAPSDLSAAPYLMKPKARVLLIGASGGFRVAQALRLGAGKVDVLEPEPILHSALLDGLNPSPPLPIDARVRLLNGSPLAVTRDAGREGYDLIDVSSDFLDAQDTNQTAFAAEAIASDLKALSPDGMVSIPVSIREFPAYAVRMLATVRAGLLDASINDPLSHVVVYRSAWGVRILVKRSPWTAAEIDQIKKFCDDRSFDISYYPGIDVEAVRGNIYNDLPSVSFITGKVTAQGLDDAVADEAQAVLAGQPSPSEAAFNLTPIRLDRPFFYAILQLQQINVLIDRLEVLPQPEIGALVNLAVLAQAIMIALIVLATPLLSPRRLRRETRSSGLRPVVYFAALGLGFLFVEIFLIEKASFYLNDRVSAFALVLTGMLVFGGLGSLIAPWFSRLPRVGMVFAVIALIGLSAAIYEGAEQYMLSTLSLDWGMRAAMVLGITAPVSIALGMPFPLGLARTGDGGFLPWAWGLNGAFSVVATPLANLIAREAGFSWLIYSASALYLLAFMTFPRGTTKPWTTPVTTTPVTTTPESTETELDPFPAAG